MTARPDDDDKYPERWGRQPDFPCGAVGDSPDPEVTVVCTRHRRWVRVPDRPYSWQPLADRGAMPEFERTWAELVDRYDVWLPEPEQESEEGTALLPPPAPWNTIAHTLTGIWKRGPADVWLKLDRHGQETTYGLTWDQLQRVPGGVTVEPAAPTKTSLQPATASRRSRLAELFERPEPLDVYGVLRGLVVSSDSLAGHADGLEHPERAPMRARVPGIGELDRYYCVVDVNPVRRDGRLVVELHLVPEPTEEGERG